MKAKSNGYRELGKGKCICGHIGSKHGTRKNTYYVETSFSVKTKECKNSNCGCEFLMLWTPSVGWQRV